MNLASIKKSVVSLVALVTLAAVTFTTSGCAQQNTIASLLAVVGTSVATLETIEGASPALVQKIQTDTQLASQAVLNWKQGNPTQDIVQALTLVQDDLGAFPVPAQDIALIDLAIGTVDQIISLLPQANTPTPVPTQAIYHYHKVVHLNKKIHNTKEFKAEWNARLKANPHGPVGAVLR